MSESQPPPDVVDRAAAAVRATPAPDAPAELMAAVTASVAARDRLTRRRKLMRYATVGGVLAAVGVGAALVSGGGSAQARLMDALKKQERAKTYTVTQHWANDGFDAKEVIKLYYSNGRVRHELPGGRWGITDEATGSLTYIDPVAKTFHVIKPDPVQFAARKNPLQHYDPYSTLFADAQKAVAAGDPTQALGVQVINGRRLKAYKVTREPVGTTTWTSTYWLDEKDDTLVRYEVRRVPGKPAAVKPVPGGRPVAAPVMTPTTTTSEFSGFDAPLDEKLFDLTPPAGYAVTEVVHKAEPAKK